MTNQEYTQLLEKMIVSLTGIELPQLHEAVSNQLNEMDAAKHLDKVTGLLKNIKLMRSASDANSRYGGSGENKGAIAIGRLSGVAAKLQDRVNRTNFTPISSNFKPRSADRSDDASTGVKPVIMDTISKFKGMTGPEVGRLPTNGIDDTVTHGSLRRQRNATIALRNHDAVRGAKGSNGRPLPVRKTTVDRSRWMNSDSSTIRSLQRNALGYPEY